MNKTVILLLTYRDSKEVQNVFDKLKGDLGNSYDFKILFNRKTSDPLQNINEDECYFFPDDIIRTMGFNPFINDENPFNGNDHYPLFKFAREHSYEQYWVIEDDVRFSGDWSVFFNALNQYSSDYFGSSFNRNLSGNLKSFNAIYMLSHKAITMLDLFFTKTQITHHHENSIAQILFTHGYTIRDFGGISAFCPVELREGFYNNLYDKGFAGVTLRATDAFKTWGQVPNKIYHPVKNF